MGFKYLVHIWSLMVADDNSIRSITWHIAPPPNVMGSIGTIFSGIFRSKVIEKYYIVDTYETKELKGLGACKFGFSLPLEFWKFGVNRLFLFPVYPSKCFYRFS